MPEVKIQTAKDPGLVERYFKAAQTEVTNKIEIQTGKFDVKDIKTIQDAMAKSRKPADFIIDFDGSAFTFAVKVGSTKVWTSTVNIAADTKITDKNKVLKNLQTYGAATPALIQAYHKKNPDRKALDELKK